MVLFLPVQRNRYRVAGATQGYRSNQIAGLADRPVADCDNKVVLLYPCQVGRLPGRHRHDPDPYGLHGL